MKLLREPVEPRVNQMPVKKNYGQAPPQEWHGYLPGLEAEVVEAV
jgi:hypothetical protein